MICIYHSSDFDGKCSGAIVRKWAKENNLPLILIGWNYGKEFPWDKITPNEQVVMVDVALETLKEMKKLADMCDLTWIDHHGRKLEEMEKLECDGLRKDGTAACELTWQYFFPDDEMPEAVSMLGRYDVWDFDSGSNVEFFQYGMKTYNYNVDAGIWNYLLDDRNKNIVRGIIDDGETVRQYQKSQCVEMINIGIFETEIDGVKAFACNASDVHNSQLFDSVERPEGKYLFILFGWSSEGQYKVSLYTDENVDVDCSSIAKKNGGGGHKQASGFSCKKLPFEVK